IAAAGGGNGGEISLLADSGPLTIASGTLSALADASGLNGTIQLIGATLRVTGVGPLELLAGRVAVTTTGTGAFSSVMVGLGNGGLKIAAGDVSVSAGVDILVDTAALTLGNVLKNGPKVSFVAGTQTNGNLLVVGDLDVTGPVIPGQDPNTGNGGTITLTSN